MQSVLSEDHLIDLLDDLHISMFIFDENLLLTWASEAALLMDGRQFQAILGKLVWDLWPAWRNAELGSALAEVIEKRTARTVRYRFQSEHNRFWATARIQPWKEGVAIVVRDQTARERTEVTQDQVRSRYNFANMSGQDVFWEWHVGEDRVVFNEATAELLGEELSGCEIGMCWWLERVHPDDLQLVKAALRVAHESRDIEWTAEFRLRVKFGRYTPVLLRGFNVYTDQGVLERVLATAIDLSAVKAAEDRARQLQDELVHVSSVNAMGAMASTLAHELNQPLTAIANYLGGCEMMLRGDKLDPAMLLKAVGLAKSSVVAAGDIIKGLRLSSFHKGLVKTRVDVRDAVDAALLQVMLGADRDYLTIKMDVQKELFIMGDAVQIKHALMILLHNAIESMKGMTEKYLELYASPYGENLILIVADNGPMISIEDRAKFFDPFFSTKERGIGLGFLVSRTIIEEHDGKIWLDESDDVGAKFVIELPLAV